MKLTERQIEKQVIDVLIAHRWRVLRTNVFGGAVIQRQGSLEPGIPDLMARKRRANEKFLVPGQELEWARFPTWRIVWIEVKRPGKDLSAAQKAWWAAHPDEEKRIATCIEDVEDLL